MSSPQQDRDDRDNREPDRSSRRLIPRSPTQPDLSHNVPQSTDSNAPRAEFGDSLQVHNNSNTLVTDDSVPPADTMPQYTSRDVGDPTQIKKNKQSMADLKLRRLTELNSRLREDLERERIPVSQASKRYDAECIVFLFVSKGEHAHANVFEPLQHHCLLQQHPGLHGSFCLGRRSQGGGPLRSSAERWLLYGHVIVYDG